MTDIFISYSKSDRENARVLAQAFEQIGWRVWWDRKIPAGEEFAEFIRKQLDGARCVVVLWSAKSVESKWVKREAARANEQEKLIPVLVEDVTPPWVFEELQARDLTHWDGSTDDGNFPQLVSDMTRLLGDAPIQGTGTGIEQEAPPPQPDQPDRASDDKKRSFTGPRIAWLGAAAVVLVLGSTMMGRWWSPEPKGEPAVSTVKAMVDVTANLDADATTLEEGQSTLLKWETTGASQVILEPGMGNIEPSGSIRVAPQKDIDYRLSAKGEAGSAEDSVRIKVISRPATAAPTATLKVDPTEVTMGALVTLTWDTSNATEVVIGPGLGQVSPSGSRQLFPGDLGTVVYTLTARGPGGTAADRVKVRVNGTPEDETIAANRRQYTVYVLGVPNADSAIAAMQATGYRASLYGPSGRPADTFQVISVGAKVPARVAQELIIVAREHLPGLRYVVITEDRPSVSAAGGRIGDRESSKEITFAVTNRALDEFREATALPDTGWQRLMAAEDDRAFQRVVRAYYRVN